MQILKEEVRKVIIDAALKVFSDRGFTSSTMSQIAETAGISTGNIYRYFSTKEDLFDAAVPQRFVNQLSTDLVVVLSMAHGLEDVFQATSENQAYRLKAEELLMKYVIEKMRVIILLDGAEGTKLKKVRDKFIEHFEEYASQYAKSLNKEFRLTSRKRTIMRLIYSAFLSNVCKILRTASTDLEAVGLLRTYRAYHLPGVKSFLESVDE